MTTLRRILGNARLLRSRLIGAELLAKPGQGPLARLRFRPIGLRRVGPAATPAGGNPTGVSPKVDATPEAVAMVDEAEDPRA